MDQSTTMMILLLAAFAASRADLQEPSYEPSGWKPSGPLFLLPPRSQQSKSSSNTANSYLPPEPLPKNTQTLTADPPIIVLPVPLSSITSLKPALSRSKDLQDDRVTGAIPLSPQSVSKPSNQASEQFRVTNSQLSDPDPLNNPSISAGIRQSSTSKKNQFIFLSSPQFSAQKPFSEPDNVFVPSPSKPSQAPSFVNFYGSPENAENSAATTDSYANLTPPENTGAPTLFNFKFNPSQTDNKSSASASNGKPRDRPVQQSSFSSNNADSRNRPVQQSLSSSNTNSFDLGDRPIQQYGVPGEVKSSRLFFVVLADRSREPTPISTQEEQAAFFQDQTDSARLGDPRIFLGSTASGSPRRNAHF